MIDATQFLLSLVIIILTVMITLIGVQVFFILREFRLTLKRANKVLEDTGIISQALSQPVNLVSGMLLGLRGGSTLMKILERKKDIKKV